MPNVVNELDASSPLWSSIDDDPDSPNDADWNNNVNDLRGGTDATAFYDVTDPASDFGNAQASSSGTIRVKGVDVETDFGVFAQFYKADQTTPLSDEVEVAVVNDGTGPTNVGFTITGIVPGNISVWAAAQLRLRWSTS
jgi:hypothetical protein